MLCHLTDLEATGAKEVVREENGERISLFVIRDGENVRDYVNSCPHARLPLNWREDMFFDLTRQYVLCANHGAYFDIATGACVRGPCVGQSLTPVAVMVDANGAIRAV